MDKYKIAVYYSKCDLGTVCEVFSFKSKTAAEICEKFYRNEGCKVLFFVDVD